MFRKNTKITNFSTHTHTILCHGIKQNIIMHVYNVTLSRKFMCQMCIKTGWVQLYNDLVRREKINCIDNKMFGNERSNEVNARYMADHFWHELSSTSRTITKSKTLADILQSVNYYIILITLQILANIIND